MSWTPDDLRAHRNRRAALGLCVQCGAPNDGETQQCSECREAARQRRARYEQTLRDRGVVQPVAHLRLASQHVQEIRTERLHELAAELGRVPTIREIGELFGYSNPASSTSAQRDRRIAFGLRKFANHEIREQVPYPVPSEWLEEAGA